MPYLSVAGRPELTEAFEAAHSVMLAVFSADHCAELTAAHLPGYVESLFVVRETCSIITLRNSSYRISVQYDKQW